MYPTVRKPSLYLFVSLLLMCFAFAVTQQAHAHKGHSGSMVSFIKSKAALKEMLPSEARIVKRKQSLGDSAVAWAAENYGVELDDGIYSYYLATDRESGDILAAAYVGQIDYRHGDMRFAVGIDSGNRITGVAVLGVNEKYVVDFESGIGSGMIGGYAGISLKELLARADSLSSSDKATREFVTAVRDAAVLLAAFINNS